MTRTDPFDPPAVQAHIARTTTPAPCPTCGRASCPTAQVIANQDAGQAPRTSRYAAALQRSLQYLGAASWQDLNALERSARQV